MYSLSINFKLSSSVIIYNNTCLIIAYHFNGKQLQERSKYFIITGNGGARRSTNKAAQRLWRRWMGETRWTIPMSAFCQNILKTVTQNVDKLLLAPNDDDRCRIGFHDRIRQNTLNVPKLYWKTVKSLNMCWCGSRDIKSMSPNCRNLSHAISHSSIPLGMIWIPWIYFHQSHRNGIISYQNFCQNTNWVLFFLLVREFFAKSITSGRPLLFQYSQLSLIPAQVIRIGLTCTRL